MAKIQVNLKLSSKYAEILEKISKETGKTKASIIEELLEKYINKKEYIDKEKQEKEEYKIVKMLEEQNKQMQIALSSFRIALDSKEEIIKEKERLIKEKEERISELKERIEELKKYQKKNKPFWKFWK